MVTYRLICADTYEDRAIHRASLEKDCLGSVIARAFERCARAKTGRARADAESARAETGGARGEAESARGETGCTRGGAEGARAEARTEEHVGFGGSVPDKTGYLFRACNLDKVTAGDRITDPFLVGFLEKWGEELVVEACEYRRLVSEQAGL